jgi:NADH-quinone oxidoreductase subunit H
LIALAAAVVFFLQARDPARKRDRFTFPVFAVVALLAAVLFAIPFLQTYLAPIFWFASKAAALLFTYIWVRGTLPRFRYDQLMHFAWTFLFPCALLNLMATAFCVAVF